MAITSWGTSSWLPSTWVWQIVGADLLGDASRRQWAPIFWVKDKCTRSHGKATERVWQEGQNFLPPAPWRSKPIQALEKLNIHGAPSVGQDAAREQSSKITLGQFCCLAPVWKWEMPPVVKWRCSLPAWRVSVFQNLVSLGFGTTLPHFSVLPRAVCQHDLEISSCTTLWWGTAPDLQVSRVLRSVPLIPTQHATEDLGCPLSSTDFQGRFPWSWNEVAEAKQDKATNRHNSGIRFSQLLAKGDSLFCKRSRASVGALLFFLALSGFRNANKETSFGNTANEITQQPPGGREFRFSFAAASKCYPIHTDKKESTLPTPRSWSNLHN